MEIEKIKRFIEICRPYNTLSGVLLFSLGVNFETRRPFNADILVGILIIILGFTFATIQNDIEDKDIDECNSPAKALPSGAITSGEATAFIKVIGLMLACLSLYHAPRHVVPVLAAFMLTWAYNKSPFLFSRRPIGSTSHLHQ